ncbi:MAG: hypothetical protein RI538_02570 [Salibaculum sp.]|jgi:hypothetical protein|uniref:hypothetical protein n=1 Tax=Roseovarius halophilus (ex Wu et al. 2025) TaxID=3376060 RepID=UPI0028707EC7|nr:hypothetical protein [Salibaculum sp.]MDR9426665.1 hypothetical protein [Salibaculum sp.]MDR9481652.1 hypothetical protein [Salibaculum sp.]
MRYLLLCVFVAGPALANPPDITDVAARVAADGWRFSVTIAHPDTGWDHYAYGWRIETEDGRVLGTRVLAHPHVNEQPFTRSLSGVEVPEGVGMVHLRTRSSVDGWNADALAFDLP